ncbi:MAG: hypothetical protein WC728_16645 [Elusimicrobiota bacterium]
MKKILAAATALGLAALPPLAMCQTRSSSLDEASRLTQQTYASRGWDGNGTKSGTVSGTGAAPNLTVNMYRAPGTGVKKPGGSTKEVPVPEAGPVSTDKKSKKDADKTKAKADEAPSDPKAVLGAAMFGLGGALIGFALGGPIGACAGFVIGAFVGALAAKMHTYAEQQAAKANK